MARHRRSALAVEAARSNAAQLARLGGLVLVSRKRRGWTQEQLGERCDLSQSTISLVERGKGGSLSMDAWQRIATVLGRPLRLDLGADPIEEPRDAGHLAMQELVIRLGRAVGYTGLFEVPTKPADPSRSTDVGLRDDRRRRLVQVECWNRPDDFGAGMRSSDRKRADAEAFAATRDDGDSYAVASCWVVRSTTRNRAILAKYPEVIASRFPGSSLAWVRALTTGTDPPDEPGLVWCDAAATKLFPWRRPRPGAPRPATRP